MNKSCGPLRAIRDGLPRPMTLAEVAALVRSQFARRCQPSHLSNIERGDAFASARLLAALAAIYGKSREEIENAYRTGVARRRGSSRVGLRSARGPERGNTRGARSHPAA